MANILIIEDDPIIGQGLTVNLQLEGYKTFWGKDLSSAVHLYENHDIDLVILDLWLPDGNGLSFCQRAKRSDRGTPIIILTAKIDEDSVVLGLNSGASDYIRKPFSVRELIARVKVGLRSHSSPQDEITYGELSLNLEQRRICGGGQEIKLNRREFDILSFLMQKAEVVITRETLLDRLDKSEAIFDRTIDSHLSHIRAKLGQAEIHSLKITSIYGVGYRLERVGA